MAEAKRRTSRTVLHASTPILVQTSLTFKLDGVGGDTMVKKLSKWPTLMSSPSE